MITASQGVNTCEILSPHFTDSTLCYAMAAVRLENRTLAVITIRTTDGTFVELPRVQPSVDVESVSVGSSPFKFTVGENITDRVHTCTNNTVVHGLVNNLPPRIKGVMYIVSLATYDALRILYPDRDDFVLVDWTRMTKTERGAPLYTLGVSTKA